LEIMVTKTLRNYGHKDFETMVTGTWKK
jgi:hypothetical protein